MNIRLRTLSLRAAAVLAALAPVLLGVELVRAAGDPGGALSTGLLEAGPLLAQAGEGDRGAGALTLRAPVPGSRLGGAGLVTGVLYTRGDATVTWSGTSLSVRNGSYAYVGGETVQMAPGSMGMLRLPDGSNVFLCPGSSVSLSRGPDGVYRLRLTRGATRFAFAAGSDFAVRADGAEIEPAARDLAAPFFEGEVALAPGGGCVVCELQRGIRISAGGSDAAVGSPSPGRVVRLSPRVAGQDGFDFSVTPIPPAALATAIGAAGEPGHSFLCRCEDLLRETERPDDTRTAAAEPATQGTADGVPQAQAAGPAQGSAEDVPPVAPPDAPPLAMAEPGAPDPFDPNVLPPPAAGEPGEPVVVVSPPAVPRSGSGGGGVASPS